MVKKDDDITSADVVRSDATAMTLPASVSGYVQAALAASTRANYRADLQRFIAYGGTVPASPAQIAVYLVAHAQSHAMATLQRWLVSLSRAHTTQGLTDPTKTEAVKTTFKGIRRQHGRPQRAVSPLLSEDLIAMVRPLSGSAKAVRDRALLLIGFAGALRRGELVGLRLADLLFSPEGLTLTLPRSKTDQEGKGQVIGIPYARGSVCPVTALQDWLAIVRPSLVGDIGTAPVFRAVNRHGHIAPRALTDRAVATIIKAHCLAAGLDPAHYAGHSLRAGFCTAAALAGKPNWQIRKQSRHKTDVMLNRYIRDGRLFADNALDGLL